MIRTERVGSERAPSGALSPMRRALASGALMGAAAIHAAVAPQHIREWAAGSLFFVGLAATQMALGLVVARGSSWRPRAASVAVSAMAISLWALSRRVGIPIGPHAGVAEAVGIADISASLLEGLTIGVLVPPLMWRASRAAAMGLTGMALSGALVAAVAIGSPVLATAEHGVPTSCAHPPAPSSYLDHSRHSDPLDFLRRESPPVPHRDCAPTD